MTECAGNGSVGVCARCGMLIKIGLTVMDRAGAGCG